MILVDDWSATRIVLDDGRFGILPAEIAVGGDEDSPLLACVDPGDDDTEFAWVIRPPLTTTGAFNAGDDGSVTLIDPDDGVYVVGFDLYTWPPGGPPIDEGFTSFTINVGVMNVLRPTSDISAGGWTPSSGSDLHLMVGEGPADDESYVAITGPGTAEVALASATDPGDNTRHTVRYRASGAGTFALGLYQGATLIASHTPTLIADLQTFSFDLTEEQAATITNYGDLRVRLVSG